MTWSANQLYWQNGQRSISRDGAATKTLGRIFKSM